METWRLYQQCQAFHKAPSDVFGIKHNRWLAWQFDNAVTLFGTWVQNRLDATDKDGKRKFKTLAAALGEKKVVSTVNPSQFMGIQGIVVKQG